jgi:hypothetical protein
LDVFHVEGEDLATGGADPGRLKRYHIPVKTSTTKHTKPIRSRTAVTQSRVPAPQRAILSKMMDLSPDKVAEVEDFIDFLRQRQEGRPLTRIADKSFAEVWDNPEAAAYDQL